MSIGPIPSLSASTTTLCPLQGLLASELVCLSCQQVVSVYLCSTLSLHTFQSPVTYEVFDSLSLNLPHGQTQVSTQWNRSTIIIGNPWRTAHVWCRLLIGWSIYEFVFYTRALLLVAHEGYDRG